MSMVERQALVILGMHRSGTSALTRVLNLCGAALPDDLLPPNAANERGYWEPARVVALNEQLLADAGTSWADPCEFPAAWTESPAGRGYVDRIAATVQEIFGQEPLFVVKDPRACRIMPLWIQALERLHVEPLVVLMVRHPLEVAASLGARDGLSVPAALILWLQHVLAAEADTRSCRRVVVAYEQLMAEWPKVVDRIETHLAVQLADERGAGTPVAESVSQFLAPALRHARHSREDLDQHPAVTRWVQAVYDWHLEAAGQEQPPGSDVLDAVRRELRNAAIVFEPLLREYAERIAAGEQRGRQLEEQIAGLEATRQEREAAWQARESGWMTRETEWQLRERALESEVAAAVQRACHLHDHILAMQRSPFWRMRTWLLRQRERLIPRGKV